MRPFNEYNYTSDKLTKPNIISMTLAGNPVRVTQVLYLNDANQKWRHGGAGERAES